MSDKERNASSAYTAIFVNGRNKTVAKNFKKMFKLHKYSVNYARKRQNCHQLNFTPEYLIISIKFYYIDIQ